MDGQRFDGAVKELLEKEGEQAFREFTDKLTPSEIKVLKALARSSGRKPNEIAKDEFMSEPAVSSALVMLGSRAILRRQRRGAYEFTDSLFAQWLKASESL